MMVAEQYFAADSGFDRRGLVAELIGCLDDHESGAGDQVVGLEKPRQPRLPRQSSPWCP